MRINYHEADSSALLPYLVRGDYYDLTVADRCAIRRFYRTLRIVVGPDGQSYGLSRQEAKNLLGPLAGELAWYTYLGSK